MLYIIQVNGQRSAELASKTDHLICRRESTRRVSQLHGLFIFICLNVGHELQGIHRAVVSVSRPVRRPVQCRCAISIPGVSAGVPVPVRIIPRMLVLQAVRVVVSVQGRGAPVGATSIGALTFLKLQCY